jgi:hypothetical protein
LHLIRDTGEPKRLLRLIYTKRLPSSAPRFSKADAYALRADLLKDTLEVDALGALDGQTQCPVPDELCEGAEATADTESRSVIQRLVEAVVVEQHTRRRIDVRERVLGLVHWSVYRQ